MVVGIASVLSDWICKNYWEGQSPKLILVLCKLTQKHDYGLRKCNYVNMPEMENSSWYAKSNEIRNIIGTNKLAKT